MALIHWGASTVDLHPDPTLVATALVAHGRTVARTFRECATSDKKISGLAWTIRDLAAHLAATLENYAKMAAGDEVEQLPLSARQQVIDQAIAERRHIGTSHLSDVIESHARTLAATVGSRDADEVVTYYGVPTPRWVVAGMCLSELIVHGNDLVRTMRRPGCEDHAGAYQAYLAGAALIPFVLTEWGNAQRLTLGYRPDGMQPIVVHLDHGTVYVAHRARTPVDVWFAGPATRLLLTAYRRTGLLGGLRTIRLQGRRPYRAITASRAFQAI